MNQAPNEREIGCDDILSFPALLAQKCNTKSHVSELPRVLILLGKIRCDRSVPVAERKGSSRVVVVVVVVVGLRVGGTTATRNPAR